MSLLDHFPTVDDVSALRQVACVADAFEVVGFGCGLAVVDGLADAAWHVFRIGVSLVRNVEFGDERIVVSQWHIIVLVELFVNFKTDKLYAMASYRTDVKDVVESLAGNGLAALSRIFTFVAGFHPGVFDDGSSRCLDGVDEDGLDVIAMIETLTSKPLSSSLWMMPMTVASSTKSA